MTYEEFEKLPLDTRVRWTRTIVMEGPANWVFVTRNHCWLNLLEVKSGANWKATCANERFDEVSK